MSTRKAIEMKFMDGDVLASDTCKRCGKNIAALPDFDALCCTCRYGPNASNGYVNHAVEMDCVEWMSAHVGFRLHSGMIPFLIQNQ